MEKKAVLGLRGVPGGGGACGVVRFEDGDFVCEAVNGAVTITGYKGGALDVAIPGAIGGLPVIAIRDYALRMCRLTSVTIPDGVAAIGASAFYYNQLTGVTIGNGVTVIGAAAFSNNRLTGVTIPGSVAEIGARAFCNNRLSGVIIGKGVAVIRDYAFWGNRLTGVVIPEGVACIGARAFAENELASVTIGAGVDVARDAFDGDLANVYARRGCRAGTYRSNDGGKAFMVAGSPDGGGLNTALRC
jgi:hypothetical protein